MVIGNNGASFMGGGGTITKGISAMQNISIHAVPAAINLQSNLQGGSDIDQRDRGQSNDFGKISKYPIEELPNEEEIGDEDEFSNEQNFDEMVQVKHTQRIDDVIHKMQQPRDFSISGPIFQCTDISPSNTQPRFQFASNLQRQQHHTSEKFYFPNARNIQVSQHPLDSINKLAFCSKVEALDVIVEEQAPNLVMRSQKQCRNQPIKNEIILEQLGDMDPTIQIGPEQIIKAKRENIIISQNIKTQNQCLPNLNGYDKGEHSLSYSKYPSDLYKGKGFSRHLLSELFEYRSIGQLQDLDEVTRSKAHPYQQINKTNQKEYKCLQDLKERPSE
ncbi:hypothetical protein FGO68_gene16579 [Halteria grandinella]|uniref:Uncharacterized protein n=1 Tax=Halteria grandinella TaxID=5974 RepID=A0A8J8NTN2_HALGN|nr:hypothetical protein FGO68_gene16579 [Halteria grandinella]